MGMIQVAFSPQNLVSQTESFAPKASGTFNMLFFYVRRHILKQGFAHEGTIVDHNDFHCGTLKLQNIIRALNLFENLFSHAEPTFQDKLPILPNVTACKSKASLVLVS
jgi:hypothetical protein